jgi:multidrug efflux pump subunit AcrA (membrane-fusion protein)
MRLYGKLILGILIVAVLALAAVGGNYALTRLRQPPSDIPTVRVLRGPLELRVYTTGELRPGQTATLVAPPVGGVLQIIHLVKSGTAVKKDDVVAEFDPSEQQYNLEQSQSQLDEAEQQIKKMKAEAAVRAAQDKEALMRAQFDVRRAELTIKGNDLLGAIEARKNVINLEEARRKLDQLERDIKSKASSDQADLAVLGVTRTRAMMTMKMAQQSIDNMILRAPIDGYVALGQNRDASGGIYFSGMELPEFNEGDQTYPGRVIAQVVGIERMEILSKVSEIDRGTLDSGQAIDVQVDALPQKRFTGTIKSLAGMAGSSSIFFDDVGATNTFDASFEMDPRGMKLNPGVSARVMIRSGSVKDALSLPRQALFQKEGKPVVYVKRAESWEPCPVQIKYLTESRAVIDGIAEGTEVALVNPELKKSATAGKSGPLAPIIGGVIQ